MKRKLSFLLALTLIIGLFAGIGVYAAYDRGAVLDFDVNTVTSFETGTKLVDDPVYGKVFNWDTRAKNLILDFSSGSTTEELTKGAHILSFDAKLAENNILYMYYQDYNPDTQSWDRISYNALRNKNFQSSEDGGNSWDNEVSGAYENDVWTHYDIIYYFDDACADIYINGSLAKEDMSLERYETINGFNKLLFVGSNNPTDAAMDTSIDNICYRSFTNKAYVEITNGNEQFDVTFSETMKNVTNNDFSVVRTPISGGEEEAVGFTYNSMTSNKGVIIPDTYENGYIYKVTYKGGESALGKTPSEIEATTVSVTLKQIIIDTAMDFETGLTGSFGTATADKVSVEDEEYRGKVFKVNGNIDWYWKLDEALDGGKYVYSFDVKNSGVWGKMRLRFYTDESYKWFNTFAIEANGMGGNINDKLKVYTDSAIPTGEWHRVDLVIDVDNSMLTGYLDGAEKGSTNLAEVSTTGSGTWNKAFWGSMMSFNNTGGDAYLDNIRTRNTDDTYPVLMEVADKYIYIDFAETTTNLTQDSFSVTKAANALSADASEVDFSLVYQNGTRAVLKLGETVTQGMRYSVKLNNVKSFLGNKPAKTELSYISNEPVTTSYTDDMSEYTKDALTNATTDTMWTNSHWTSSGNTTQQAQNYTTAANGTVTLTSGTDGGKLLRYNILSEDIVADEGIIEIETKLNITHTSGKTDSTALVYYNFQDADGTYKIGEFQANGFMGVGSTAPDTRKITTAKDTSYVYGQDSVIKTTIDLEKKTISTSVNNNDPIIINQYVCGDSDSVLSNDLTGVNIISLQTLANTGAIVKLDSIKISKKVPKSVVGNVLFGDVMGNESSIASVSSATGRMMIEFPNGLLDDTISGNGTIEVKSGTSVVPVDATNSSYNPETGVYTMVFDRLLGANKKYDVSINDVKDENGVVYDKISGTFTTGESVSSVLNKDVTKTADGISVTVEGVNTGDEETYYVIYTGYKENKLVAMDYEVWKLNAEFMDYTKTFNFTDAGIADCDKVNSYIWRGFGNIRPVTNSITK